MSNRVIGIAGAVLVGASFLMGTLTPLVARTAGVHRSAEQQWVGHRGGLRDGAPGFQHPGMMPGRFGGAVPQQPGGAPR